MLNNKKCVITSFISIGTYQAFIDEILFLAQSKIPSYVCFANVHTVVESYRDRSFQRIINQANLAAPDGRPLSIFLRLAEGIKQDRVCGMDLLPELLKQAQSAGKSVFFYGSTEDLLITMAEKARSEFPALKLAGWYAPPFRALSAEEDEMITGRIIEAKPDLVFVSLGCPKQERWMAQHKNRLNACLLGFGQAFKVYAGEEKRLPKWMRNLSLEWAYRLYLEPNRLWKRYLYTNSIFLLLVIRHFTIRFLLRYPVKIS